MVSIAIKGAGICLLGLLLVHFYKPVPEGMPADDQWLLRKIHVAQRIGAFVARIGHLTGYDSMINIKRNIRRRLQAKPKPSDVQSERRLFDGVPVTVYTKASWMQSTEDLPLKVKVRPAIYYIHGGGWVFGHDELHAVLERRFVEELNFVLVSVDYRLAPEHPYPVPFNDCLTALKYFHAHSTEFGVDPTKISIAGDSAGGNLAAAVTLKLRDEGRTFLHRQILLSPATQMVTFLSKSYADNGPYSLFTDAFFFLAYMDLTNTSVDYHDVLAVNGHLSDRILQHNAWPYIDKYHTSPLAISSNGKNDDISRVFEEKLLDPYMWPMMADSLAGLPPALVLLSEYDVLRDDALAYADRLQAEGTETVTVKTAGFHGTYCLFAQSSTGEAMVRAVVDFLRDAYTTA